MIERVAIQLISIAGIHYALKRMLKGRVYLNDGHLELGNNICERPICPIALGRENHLLKGFVGCARVAAIAYSLIKTAKLNNVDPEVWLTWGLERLPEKINSIDELMSWAYAKPHAGASE